MDKVQKSNTYQLVIDKGDDYAFLIEKLDIDSHKKSMLSQQIESFIRILNDEKSPASADFVTGWKMKKNHKTVLMNSIRIVINTFSGEYDAYPYLAHDIGHKAVHLKTKKIYSEKGNGTVFIQRDASVRIPKRDLRVAQFGESVLRAGTLLIDPLTLYKEVIQHLIGKMYALLEAKKLGVGLAAPQVGVPLALAVINIQPTKARPDEQPFKLTIINPVITKVYGKRVQMYEGCISGTKLFAKVPRYKKVRLQYYDELGRRHEQDFEGLPAHVIQHEVDHLKGILFVDLVKDTTSYTTEREYIKYKKRNAKIKI
jgi:peptide deformylase